jgi:FG-GAP-like repeat
MPDLAVILSCGVSNFADPNEYALVCVNGEVCPPTAITNYLGISDPAPNPPVGSDLTLAQEASPTHWMHVGMCPFWAMCSSKDSLGIPTATGFSIHSYLPDNMPGVLENGENGIVPTASAIGLTESTSTEPEVNSFRATIVPVSVHEHSFDYWDQVKSDVIAWISAPIGSTPPASIKVPGDFNNDGYSDYLLYNASTGQTVIYYMNNNVLMSSTYGATVPSGWQIAGVGDFDRDGHPDYLLFNAATGQTVIYYMNNNVLTASSYGPTLPAGWTVAGVADFNLDGSPDYLLYSASTGQTQIFYMNNSVQIGSAFGPIIPGGWQIAGVGDFDRDGHPDYLLFNPATGQTVIYYMNNKILTASTYGPTLPGGWAVAGVGAFNLDDYPDYLLYNATTGSTVIWYMNNNVQIGSTSGPTVPGGWIPVAP